MAIESKLRRFASSMRSSASWMRVSISWRMRELARAMACNCLMQSVEDWTQGSSPIISCQTSSLMRFSIRMSNSGSIKGFSSVRGSCFNSGSSSSVFSTRFVGLVAATFLVGFARHHCVGNEREINSDSIISLFFGLDALDNSSVRAFNNGDRI